MANFGILSGEKDIRRYAAGEAVSRDGEPGDAMYGVVEGEVEILKNEPSIRPEGVHWTPPRPRR
jgi:CRP-like cAMP-binding protein